MDAMKIANSIPMWIACGIPVILVIAQALIFAKNLIRQESCRLPSIRRSKTGIRECMRQKKRH